MKKNLDNEYITVTLSEGETFIDYMNLKTDSFILVGEPPGTFIESVTGNSATEAQIDLEYNGTDFDIEYPDFHVLINNKALSLSTEDLATDSISIDYALEPVITNVSIPNDTMRIGTIVNVTISVEDDEGLTFTLEAGSIIGGYPLTNLTRINNTIYSCTFSVIEGGIDYSASENIPVQIRLLNGEIEGNLYNEPIIQDLDLLDSNSPAFQYIYTIDEGAQSIGDEFTIWIQTDGSNYNFTPTSHVNNIPLAGSSIEISPVGSGRYSLRYIVQENDNNVNTGELTLSMVAIDIAGNLSLPFTTIDPNDLSIDASRPQITRAYIYSTDDFITVGEILVIRVEADQAGYRNDNANTWINNVYIEPDHLTFSDLGDGLYEYHYTVQKYDGSVEAGNLYINFILLDRDPFENTSIAFTDLDSNSIWIDTSLPYPPPFRYSTEICLGDSARLTIILGGTPPWTIDISDGTSTTQHTSSTSTYTFWVHPQVTTAYMVTRVVDGNGDEYNVSGIATITVPPLPYVQILNLQGIYDVTDPPVVLEYTTLGGFFIGPGISTDPWTFDPGVAGVSPEGSPHKIEYYFTDPQTGCTVSDIKEVIVKSEFGNIIFEKPVACFNDSTFKITANNTWNNISTFEIKPTPPPGAFIDSSNNTAILRPELYNLTSTANLTIIYSFVDSADQEISIPKALTIEYLEDVKIDSIPIHNLCQNDTLIELSGYPAGGIFFGNGVTENVQDSFWFDPSQAYLDTNIIQYIYTSERGCSVQDSIDLIVHFAPNANFTTNGSCVSGSGGQIQFKNLSDTGIYQVKSWKWNFEYPSEDEENISDLRSPSHYYESGLWTVKLTVEIDNGCSDSTKKTITLSPSYTLSPDQPYLEDFEDSLHVWTSVALDSSYQNTWTFGEVDSTNFPWNASSGTMAWYTDRSTAQILENSWVLSPCFNFENFYRPMVSLDIKRSLDHNNDGTSLQYTINNGKNWITIGGINDGGINWYNSDSIWDGFSNQKRGWTGEKDFSENSIWYKAAYWLDELIGHDTIQFRITFSSNGDTTVHSNGFAFDNFTIKQRSRLSVLEYFTNANTIKCAGSDSLILSIIKESPQEVIDIQYHSQGSQADKFYQDNWVPANSRGTVYGITGIPYAILDGGIELDDLGRQMVYDFNENDPNPEDIRLRSLMDPDFNLTIYGTTPSLNYPSAFVVAMEALRNLERKERTLYTILLQTRVDDPEYVGNNGVLEFRHVARKMLPDAGGTYLGNKEWIKGETEYVNYFWDTCGLSVVAFLQDDETREILQAVTIPENCITNTPDKVEPKAQVLLYPNPASEIVNIFFEEIPKEEMQFILYDPTGKIVISDVIESWQQCYTRSIWKLEPGMYIVEIRTNNDKQFFYRGKLLHY